MNIFYRTFFSFAFFFFGTYFSSFAQKGFKFIGNTKEQIIPIDLINNIVIIPLEVNGKELSFILDTGIRSTILFNLNPTDSLSLHNVKRVKLYGLGSKDPIDALLSKNNHFRYKKIYSSNQDLYVVLNGSFDLSSKLGKTIHGIIGSSFFENFIVEINYKKKRVKVSNPIFYKYKKCNKCETIDLEFYKKKPFFTATITQDGKEIPVHLLIDTGSSDSLWLFEDEVIKLPKKTFLDFLGVGLSGNIKGSRGRITAFKIGKHILKEPTTAYPDSISVPYLKSFAKRNGSVGGSVLSRFRAIYDYKNKKMTLKPNSKFKTSFKYNMSGLEVVYRGKILIKELVSKSKFDDFAFSKDKNQLINTSYTNHYTYKFKSTYKIQSVRKGSVAEEVGLQANDLILEINGKPAYDYTLQQIYGLFYEKENKRLEFLVRRGINDLGFIFRLRKLL